MGEIEQALEQEGTSKSMFDIATWWTAELPPYAA
jgi:hypothetical protein